MAPSSSNQAVQEFDLSVALSKLGLTQAQFIDLCIMCGCDYASNIRGIGPVRALEYIRKHGTLEKVGLGLGVWVCVWGGGLGLGGPQAQQLGACGRPALAPARARPCGPCPAAGTRPVMLAP
jgi:hypothetical protein